MIEFTSNQSREKLKNHRKTWSLRNLSEAASREIFVTTSRRFAACCLSYAPSRTSFIDKATNKFYEKKHLLTNKGSRANPKDDFSKCAKRCFIG